MNTILQILTLLVVIKATMSSTIEMLVSETTEVTTKNEILHLETESFVDEVTAKPLDVQIDPVIKFITTRSSLTSVDFENVPTESQSETFVEDVTTQISTINLEIQDLMTDDSRKTTEIQQNESFDEENTVNSSNSKAVEKQLQVSSQNLTLDNKQDDFQINYKSPEAQTEEIVSNRTSNQTPTLTEEPTTKPSTTLEEYAVREMIFILDHILLASQEFVYKVLQATGNSMFQRDHLKRYAEDLDILLNPDIFSDEIDVSVVQAHTQPEEPYKNALQKLAFLKGKSTKQLQEHLPVDWIKTYKSNRHDVSIWLDKASEQMRTEFNKYISDETDHVKYQYFNEAFDDIARATEIHQKLAIIVDLIQIIKNKKQITFLDLYMQ